MAGAALLTAALTVVDCLVAPRELSTAVFYLIPVALVAWFGRSPLGLLAATFAALGWHAADVLKHAYANPAAPYWNSGVRLVFFAVIAFLLTQMRQALEREKVLASSDPLTGAANSRRLYAELDRERARSSRTGRPFTVALIDLDNFKLINDLKGHAVGDRVLREVVEMVQRSIRSTDLLARVGGDEFALLLVETDEEGARECVTKIKRAVSTAMKAQGWSVTCSIGAVIARGGELDSAELIHRADELMFEVKRGSKDSVRIEVVGGARG